MQKLFTLTFDWDTGHLTMEDDAGHLRDDAIVHVRGVAEYVLRSIRATSAIAEAEAAVADAQQRLEAEKAAARTRPTLDLTDADRVDVTKAEPMSAAGEQSQGA